MGDTARPGRLVETAPVDWTPQRLRDWIDGYEHLLAKIRQTPTDPEFEWIRSLLETELERKRRILAALQAGSSAMKTLRLKVTASGPAVRASHLRTGDACGVAETGQRQLRKQTPLGIGKGCNGSR